VGDLQEADVANGAVRGFRYCADVSTLVLLRHGESVWNEQNLFTGWQDVGLSERGRSEAVESGRLLVAENGIDLRVLHTSVLVRAIHTAELALAEAGRSWLPVRRSWRLNERHYGDLTGQNKRQVADEHGQDRLRAWRRSYDVAPPPLPEGDSRSTNDDPRYRDVPRELLPSTECLCDVVARVLPWFDDALAPDLAAEAAHGGAVLVVAHGNSLRALRMHLEKLTPDEVVDLEIPTGIPFVYELDDDRAVKSSRYLGDPGAAARAADAVKRQAG
jgi:2,3-bisphosphoglycerate-dependent phosphoglycerate mutase